MPSKKDSKNVSEDDMRGHLLCLFFCWEYMYLYLEIGQERSLKTMHSKFKIWKSRRFPDFGAIFQKKGTFIPVIPCTCTYTLIIRGHSVSILQ